MIKILHTGDLHIGRAYAKYESEAPELAKRYREARIEALEKVVQAANENNCDYMVIAGDMYDVRNIPQKLHKTVCEILGKCACTVLIIPGNHDFCEGPDDALWNDFDRYCPDNAAVLRRYAVYETEKAAFYPCGCTDRYSEGNALGWLKDPPRSKDKPNIGIAHGALEGLSYDKEGKYYGMTARELSDCGMDLWLLGHTHVPCADGNIFNAGTHQQTDAADSSEGSVFLITMGDDRSIHAEKIPTSVIHFRSMRLNLRHGESLRAAAEKLLCGDTRNTSYRLELSGVALEEDYNGRAAIYAELREKTLSLRISDSGLSPEITERRINEETLPDSVENRLLRQYANDPELLNLAFGLVMKCKEGGQ